MPHAESTAGAASASVAHQRLDHLLADRLLEREPFREGVHEAREGADPEYVLAGKVGYQCLTQRRHQMVRTHRCHADMFHEHQVLVTSRRTQGLADEALRIDGVASQQLVRERAGDALGGPAKLRIAIWITPQRSQEVFDG